jgi:hypothetical protein
MKRKILQFTSLFIMTLALAPACQPAPSTTGDGSFQVWIDAPLEDAVLPLAPYEIVFHASGPDLVTTAEIIINDQVQESVSITDQYDLLFTAQQTWTPEEPGEYSIRARTQNSAGDWADSPTVHVKIISQLAIETDLILASDETSTPEPTVCEPQLTAAEKTTCRSGPSPYHIPMAYLQEGESAPVSGMNQDGNWWFAQLADQENGCWINAATCDASCLDESLPIVDSPPYITRINPSNPEFYWGDNPLQSITVRAQVDGESPVSSVLLIYHLQGKQDWRTTSMVNTSGNIWEGTLQSRSFNNYKNVSSAVVEYYLKADSQNGLSTQSALLADIKLKKVP